MSIQDRVLACIKAHRGVPYCAHCIAAELGIIRIRAIYEAMAFLSWQSRLPIFGVVRERGVCKPCGNTRLIARAVVG